MHTHADPGRRNCCDHRYFEGEKVGEGEKVETVLEEAQRLIYGDREKAYGNPRTSGHRLAAIWSAILTDKLDAPITAEEAMLMLVGLKISREIGEHRRDNIIDIAGYAGVLGKMYDQFGPLE
jgi:hypothetical protein